jgi:HEPN domain-containing protein
MLKFLAPDWNMVVKDLRDLRDPNDSRIAAALLKGDHKPLVDAIGRISSYCQKIGMVVSHSHSTGMLARIILQATIMRSGPPHRVTYPPHKFLRDMETLTERFEREIYLQVFLAFDADKVRYFQSSNLFGEPVSDKFSSAVFDIEETGNCFALGRWTACVFHSMRVLERGLHALATDLGVPYKVEAWGGVLKDIEKAIQGVQSVGHASPKWSNLGFYSESALEFRYFKDAWRNHVMHGQQTYDEGKAKIIMEHVQNFMQRLAERLSDVV